MCKSGWGKRVLWLSSHFQLTYSAWPGLKSPCLCAMQLSLCPASRSALEIMLFLNQLYSIWDAMLDQYCVYKVKGSRGTETRLAGNCLA